MYIDVSPFFYKNWPKVQQRSALESIVPVWADLKSLLFWILAFFFFFFSWSSCWIGFFKWTDCFSCLMQKCGIHL